MNDDRIIDFLNGRTFPVLAALLLALLAVVALVMECVPTMEAGSGLLYTIDGAIVDDPMWSMLLNVACLIAIGLMLVAMNKFFNFIRAFTFIFAPTFFLLQAANPLLSSAFGMGTVLCLTLTLLSFLLLSSYQNPRSQRSVFITFALLSAGCMFHYTFLVLVVLFLLSYLNMRALNFKSLLAMLIGLITPFWIALGLGLVSLSDIALPHITAVWDNLELSQVRVLVASAAVTVVITITLTVMNLMRILNYRLQTRVYNTYFALVSLLAVVAMSIDYPNMSVYMPMLNLGLAVQVAHAFTLNTWPKRHYAYLVLVVLCLGTFLANLLL